MTKKIFYCLNICLLIALLLSCLSCYIDPAIAWPLSFLGLAFPVLILFLLAFIFLWIIWRQKFLWVNVVAIIVCWPFIRSVVGFHFSPAQQGGIKIMSYNVRNFDLYNWSGNMRTRAKMMQLIAAESPDIICFQEFYTDDGDFHNLEYMTDSLGYKYHYLHVTYSKWYKNTEQMKWYHLLWGLAIFSRYEIRDTGMVAFPNKGDNQCIFAGLSVAGKPLRIYNTHLQSIYLDNDDYDTIEELRQNQNSNWYRIRHVIRKMKLAFTRRGHQAQAVHDHISHYSGHKILCGDFNDTPVSYTYQTICSGLQDAFTQRGKGFGQTFVTNIGLFRIDYIMPDKTIKVNSYKSIEQDLSDHYPVVVRIEM
jgi:endonuclease/exonuclease/phosphatase family metal-dependent hydrolase